MNRTPLPPPCVPLALRVRTRLPVSQQVLLHCGDLRTVVLTEAALKMLEEISSVKHIPEFVRRAKDKMILSA